MSLLIGTDFHKNATISSNGVEMKGIPNRSNVLVVSVDYNATSATIIFEGQGRASKNGANWTVIKGMDISTSTYDTSFTLEGIGSAVYQIDTTGIANFRVKLTAIVGGTITVLGDAYDG